MSRFRAHQLSIALAFVLLSLVPACSRPVRTLPSIATDAEARALAGQVEVIRTAYGVPHIYAANFTALGYALGYLQLEDYGERVPAGLLRVRGELARYTGRTALDSDFENRESYLRAIEVYAELAPDTRAVYEGFAAGVNRYIRRYSDEFPEWMPSDFTGHDVAALYVYRPTAREIQRWRRRLTTGEESMRPEAEPAAGSSAWALGPSRTVSGAAILLRNPHLDWDAGYWEAHVVVPGRLEFYGDFRIGGPLGIIGGFNRRLGFATTNNDVNSSEVYALDLDPEREGHYLFDGVSVPIRRTVLTLPYREGGGYAMETRVHLDTDLGRVLAQDDGTVYVLRAAEDGKFRGGEQFLRLMQARNLEEWKDAMRLGGHPVSNFVYADAVGNIFYLWNAAIPVRPHPAGENLPVPASRTEHIWTELHDLESLPQLLNPEGGYVRNENDGPWLTNLHQPLDPADYPAYFEEHTLGLRSQHALLLIDNDARLPLEDVVGLKHSYRMLLADRVKDDLLTAVREATGLEAGGDILAAAQLLGQWDHTAGPRSRGAVLFAEWWRLYTDALGDREPFREPWDASAPTETPRGLSAPELAAEVFRVAVEQTAARFGSWDVAWGEVHRVRRGEVDAPVGGCGAELGCFRVLDFRTDADGRRSVSGGDGWVIAVEFTDPPRAYSILGYGQSAREDSPHHADQAALFAEGRMKRVAYTRVDVEREAERRYRPGLE